MPTEEQEFEGWLKRNKQFLAEHSLNDVVQFAFANGFTRSMVYARLSHWAMDRISHSKYADREWFHVQRELDSVNFLKSQWERLHRYNIGLD